jgi:hypothetical protein
MGQTHSNINNGEAERAMVEQDAMVLNEEPVMKKQVSSSLAETSVEEESDDDYDAEFEEARAERRRILEEAEELKRLARMYLHPEDPVVSSPSACARCYFDRASAVEQESYEEAEERASVLADAANLKRLAVHYMHPEIGVQTTDPTVFGRNYYSRFSADDVDSIEESDERARALADCTALIRRLEDTSSGIETLKVVSSVSPKVFSAPILKTVDTSVTKSVSRSASHVKLFGLDEENGDATF